MFNLRRSTRDVTHTDTHSKHSEYTTHASIAGRNAAVTAAAVNPAMGSVSTHVSTMRPKRPLYTKHDFSLIASLVQVYEDKNKLTTEPLTAQTRRL